jgi:hypothetical protein
MAIPKRIVLRRGLSLLYLSDMFSLPCFVKYWFWLITHTWIDLFNFSIRASSGSAGSGDETGFAAVLGKKPAGPILNTKPPEATLPTKIIETS